MQHRAVYLLISFIAFFSICIFPWYLSRGQTILNGWAALQGIKIGSRSAGICLPALISFAQTRGRLFTKSRSNIPMATNAVDTLVSAECFSECSQIKWT
jgi:hypothetical protein